MAIVVMTLMIVSVLCVQIAGTCLATDGQEASGPIARQEGDALSSEKGKAGDQGGTLSQTNGNGLAVNSHPLTLNEVQNLQATIGTRDPNKDYNVIIDGHGTGAAPPTAQLWSEMVGNVSVVESLALNGPAVPSSYDLSSSVYFPHVGDQGGQGSCAAWAATYYDYGFLEAQDRGWSGAAAGIPSELISPAWTYNRLNGGTDSGSWMYNNMMVIETWGAPTMAAMPYDDTDLLSWGSQDAFREAPLHRAANVYYLPYSGASTVATVKDLVYSGLPVTFALDAYQFSNGFADGNTVISAAEYSSSTTNHAQTVVGYSDSISDDGDVGAFRVVNSWGTSFGENGYYWLTYNAFMEIGDLLQLTYLTDKISYQPSLLATWHFNSAPTRDATIRLSAVDTGSQTDLADLYPYFNDDSSNAFPTFMCYDISDLSGYLSQSGRQVNLLIGGATTNGYISSFKIEKYDGNYVPGYANEISQQASGLPSVTPSTVTNLVPTYTGVSTNSALGVPTNHFKTLGNAGWVSENSQWLAGGYAMQSGDVGDGGSSTLQVNVIGPGHVIFYWKISSEGNYDYLGFYQDGVQMIQTSGSFDWAGWNVSIADGVHTLKWSYIKDGSLSAAGDCGYLDITALSQQDDGYEVNNVAATATPISSGTHSDLRCLDDDWYRVWLKPGDDLSSTINFIHSKGDLDLYLYGPDGTTILSSSTSVTNQEQVSVTNAGLWGYYYIKVHGFLGDVNVYSMTVTLDALPDPGATSSVHITGGTGSFAGVSDSNKVIVVEHGTSLAGQLNFTTVNTWASGKNVPVVVCPSWGVTSENYLSGTMSSPGSVNWATPFNGLTVPDIPGTYHIVIAFRNESDRAFVASATAAQMGQPLWDSNDIANFSASQIGNAQNFGRAWSLWRVNLFYYYSLYVPADALTIVVPDDISPVTTPSVIGTSGTNGWYTSPVSLTLAATDVGSGVSSTHFRINGGAWNTYTVPLSFSTSGTFNVDYYSVDNATNTENIKSIIIRIDTIAPTVVISQPLVDAYLDATSVMVVWTASDSGSGINYIEVRIDGSATWTNVGTVSAHTFTGLSDGAHAVDVRTFDMAMNTASASRSFTIDTVAPTVVISQPLVDAYLDATSVMVVWTASDSGSGINYIEVRIDGSATWTNVGTVSAHTFTGLSDGAHAVDVRTFDMAMNTASASRSFTIDTVAPVVTISFPSEGKLFGVDTVTVYWNGTDLNGIDHYEVSYNGDAFMSVGSNISKEFAMLSDGMHNVVVKAFDLAMNTNSSFVNFVTDSTDPDIIISFPGLGYMTNLDNVTVYWNATDATSGINHTTYAIDGGAAIKIEGVGPYSMWFAALSEGSHTVEVIAYDIAGHHKGASVAFLVDLTAPTIAITAPVQDHYYNVALIHGAWTVVDPTSGVAQILVKLGRAVDWTSIGWNATYDFAGLTHGDHTIYVKAIDNVTNERIVSVLFHVDLVAPDVTISFPSEGQLFNVDNVTVHWSATDGSGVNHTTYAIDGEVAVRIEGAGPYSKEFTGLNDGMHHVVVQVFDLAMNVGSASVNFTIDRTDPIVTISFPPEGQLFGVDTVTVYWNGTDLNGIDHYEVSLNGGAFMSVGSDISKEFAALSEGSHRVDVVAYDRAGNTRRANVTFLVDLTAPTIAITAPVQDDYYNVALIHGAWTVVDPTSGVAQILVKLGRAVDWTSIGWNATHDFAGLMHGDHTIYVKAIDNVTNERIVSVLFHVDLVAPTITAKSPTGAAVAIGTNVSVTFSEAMLKTSVSIVGVPAVTMGTPIWSSDNKTVTWTPSSALACATNYTLTVSGTDLAGNPISGVRVIVFNTITQVTGTIKDANGNPIQGANVTLSMPGMATVYTLTDANGHFVIVIAGGTYALKVTKSGFDDLNKQITVGPGLVNDLGNMSTNPTAGYTLPIVVVVIVLGAALVFLFLRRRKGKK